VAEPLWLVFALFVRDPCLVFRSGSLLSQLIPSTHGERLLDARAVDLRYAKMVA
jgi:hypothetical protein